jgi:5-carboxyvanillate decarboxylase
MQTDCSGKQGDAMETDRRSFLSGTALATAALTLPGVVPAQAQQRKFRRIATEEAFATTELMNAYRVLIDSTWDDPDIEFLRILLGNTPLGNRVRPGLLDIEQGRIRSMVDHGVDVQVLSLTSPGVQLFSADTGSRIAENANDLLAEAITRHKGRYAGLATVAPQDAGRAAKEIERARNSLKLNGVIINSHTQGEYLDQKRFWPLLEAAEATDSAIYIHPRNLPRDAAGPYLDLGLGGSIWGYQAETGLHGMRLIASGVLDRFPNLKIVLGHGGEGVPYWVYRIDHMAAQMSGHDGVRPKLKPSEYLKRNFLITTSGMNHEPALQYCRAVLPRENIMWAIDYPYQDTKEAVDFMNSAAMPDEDKSLIYGGNAERIFHLG